MIGRWDGVGDYSLQEGGEEGIEAALCVRVERRAVG